MNKAIAEAILLICTIHIQIYAKTALRALHNIITNAPKGN